MKNFWLTLKKPFFALAPMDDVTDTVFRQIVTQTARPDVFFTEFVNVDGLSDKRGFEKLAPKLKFAKIEKPLVAQIWGLNPDHYFQAAKLIQDLSFDGIDINMGCPDKKAMKKGACAALIHHLDLAKQFIQAVKAGAPKLPLSVKTRIGIKEIETEKWLGFLLEQDLQAVTVHGRTVQEMSKVPTHWEEIGKAVKLRDEMGVKTLIIGNGDVVDREDGLIKAQIFKVDGVMIGRGIFQNIGAFAKTPIFLSTPQSLLLLKEHIKLFNSTYGKSKNFNILKKFFKIYVSGFEGASELRTKLMATQTASEAAKIISPLLGKASWD